MGYLPIFMHLTDKRCLVVGGGVVAARKVATLRNAKARVLVVAPLLCEALASRHARGEIDHQGREFAAPDLDGCELVIAASDDADLNARISELAQAKHLPVNVVDSPQLCSFIMPSIVDRAPVQIAVSTGGSSPVLARLLRARLETLIPANYGRLAELMAAFRAEAKAHLPSVDTRRRFWEKVLAGPIAEMLLNGREQAALKSLKAQLQQEASAPDSLGEVYLVGSGPGDPDLLTFRALRLMQQADVVLYDRLVTSAIVELCRKDAERIYVGKRRAAHTLRQDEINSTMVRLAKAGKRVLRLKGGDPFIFGRGGEEIASLSHEGIPFQVVPGVTAASGCACYAGIPLTHRDYAQSCVFVTGHLKGDSINLNWGSLIQPQQTIVVYMGLVGLADLCSELIRKGMQRTMPAALVQQGTTVQQRVFTGTVESLPGIIRDQAIEPPTLVIIGEVVKLQESLAWFRPVPEPSAAE